MSDTPPPSPVQRIATVFGWILTAVRRGVANNLAKLEGPVQVALYNLLGRKITHTRDRLIRLAERVAAGWIDTPKPHAPRQRADRPKERPPQTKNPLVTGSHWLFRAAPGHDTAAAAAAADLRSLLAEPEIAAVLAAAPKPAWRILRSVCWMLGVEKPPVLARLDPRPPKRPKPGIPLPPPRRPPPWEILPPTPDASYYHRQPSFFWPWIGPKPKTA